MVARLLQSQERYFNEGVPVAQEAIFTKNMRVMQSICYKIDVYAYFRAIPSGARRMLLVPIDERPRLCRFWDSLSFRGRHDILTMARCLDCWNMPAEPDFTLSMGDAAQKQFFQIHHRFIMNIRTFIEMFLYVSRPTAQPKIASSLELLFAHPALDNPAPDTDVKLHILGMDVLLFTVYLFMRYMREHEAASPSPSSSAAGAAPIPPRITPPKELTNWLIEKVHRCTPSTQSGRKRPSRFCILKTEYVK